jgi:hypothetical protein
VTDASLAAHPLRSYNDAMGGDGNSTDGPGGFGPNFVLAYSLVSGQADDGIEHEGSAQVGVLLGNLFDARRARPFSKSPPAALGLSVPYWGPTYVVRNVFRRHSPENWPNAPRRSDTCLILKIKRGGKVKDPIGHVYFLHNTAYSPREQDPRFSCITVRRKPWGDYLWGANNLALLANPFKPHPGKHVTWSPHNVMVHDYARFPKLVGRTHIPISPAGLANAEPLPNINDAGPWAAAQGPPLIGAAEHAR